MQSSNAMQSKPIFHLLTMSNQDRDHEYKGSVTGRFPLKSLRGKRLVQNIASKYEAAILPPSTPLTIIKFCAVRLSAPEISGVAHVIYFCVMSFRTPHPLGGEQHVM